MKPDAKARRLSGWLIFGWLVCGAGGAAFAQTALDVKSETGRENAFAVAASPSPTPPVFKVLRYEEDWSFLKDKQSETKAKSEKPVVDFERLKYIPLGAREGWYLSVGGDVRQRYERTGNPLWGQERTDGKDYYQQRYLLHGDFHFGKSARVFAQLGNQFETGRTGRPRPTDEDRLDVSQLFIDYKFDFGEKRSVTLRAGRQEMTFGGGFLVAVREPLNVRRGFDGGRVILNANEWRVVAFLTKPVANLTRRFRRRSRPGANIPGRLRRALFETDTRQH